MKIRARSLLLVATLLPLIALPPSPAAADENDLLDFCVSNPDHCAISVHAIDEGWEAHLNPDRPQVLASTSKILMLLAYGQAVADGVIDPDDTIDRDEWARFLTLDGFALKTSWEDLGMPTQVRWGDLARMMILHSDNATPDLIVGELGTKRLKQARKLFRGFHDLPLPISAMFGLWFNGNGTGGTGDRVATDYGSFGIQGYQKEASAIFKQLMTAGGLETYRRSLCVRPPWEGGGACNPPADSTELSNRLAMMKTHFTRSTTRTYADLMSRMLQGTLLKADEDAVVRPILEQWLDEFPTLSPAFSRYGLKGGSLAGGPDGNELITWAHYMQTGSGQRYVAVVFLQALRSTGNPPDASDINAFAQQFSLNAAFRSQVRTALQADDARPEVIGQILKLKGKGKVTLRGRVENAGPTATDDFVVRVYVSDDAALDAGDTLIGTVNIKGLKDRKGKNFTVKGNAPGGAQGKFALLSVDDDDALNEQDEDNNLLHSRIY